MTAFTTIGKSVPKIDVKEKATGHALYAADLKMPGMLFGKVVRCLQHAHAKVVRLDLTAAARMPGVIKVLGPDDVKGHPYNTGVLDLMVPEHVGQMLGDIEDQVVFTRHVKHQGDAICGIIARSEEQAERAAEKVIVEYEPLPVYLTAEQSMQPDAVQFTPLKPGNRAFQLPGEMFPNNAYGWGDVDDAMAKADFFVEDTFYVPKQKQCQMEPNAYVAKVDDSGRLHCWTSTQMPKCVHIKLARMFDLPMSKVTVTQTVVGGGFGARLGMIGEPIVSAMAMAVPGRPIKLLYSREEDWIASESRHLGKYWMKIGFAKTGEPVAVDALFRSYKGAYYTQGSGVAFTTGSWLGGMYKWGACRYHGETYYTNHAPCGAYRGYGNPQTNFVMEQLIERACGKMGADPVEWRKKWHKTVGDDGWCPGVTYPSCALDECLDRGAAAIGWTEKRKKFAGQTGVKRRGVGVSVMTHTSGAFPMLLEHTTATVRINEDASAEIMLACSDMGQGAHTALQQIAAETLGFPMSDIHLKTGDSESSGFDIGAHASRTVYVGGAAVKSACENAVKELLDRAAQYLDCPADQLTMRDKVIHAQATNRSISVAEISARGVYNYPDPATGERSGIPGQIQAYSSHLATHNSPPFAACFAEVEVDMETGEIQLIELVNAHDVGRAIHPASVEGNLEGGAQQGMGFALTEEIYYDDKGLCQNNSFTDYKMLGPSDMPKLTTILVEDPDPIGPYGAKSAGEAGIVAPIGAVANAIFHATGVQILDAPITPEKILKALKANGLSM